LQSLGYDTSSFRSKSWNEFAKPGAPPLDFAFTVCDNAAGATFSTGCTIRSIWVANASKEWPVTHGGYFDRYRAIIDPDRTW